MPIGDKSRTVSMQCPTCGGTDFEFDDAPMIKCAGCDRVMTKDELREANGARIEMAVDEFKAEIFKDVTADLRKAFKKWK